MSPYYTIETNEPACFGELGSINIIENGENIPYSYNFENNITSPPFSILAGEHQIIITDIENCSDTTTVTLNEPNILDLDYDLTNRSCFGQIDVDVKMEASGGTSPYIYFGQCENTYIEGQTLNNLQQNNYILIATDYKNCIAQKDLLLVEPAQLLANYNSNNSSCIGNHDGSVEFFFEGGTEPYFLIYEQDTFNTPIISDLTDGIYDFIIQDTNQCKIEIHQISLTDPDIE